MLTKEQLRAAKRALEIAQSGVLDDKIVQRTARFLAVLDYLRSHPVIPEDELRDIYGHDEDGTWVPSKAKSRGNVVQSYNGDCERILSLIEWPEDVKVPDISGDRGREVKSNRNVMQFTFDVEPETTEGTTETTEGTTEESTTGKRNGKRNGK